MNRIAELISENRIACRNQVSSKKRALEWLSELVIDDNPALTQLEVFESFFGRERLGSTGLGHGVAIPHGRLKNITRPVGVFLQLRYGIDYDALDGRPVDLIFALLVPEDCTQEHLEILSMLAAMFSDERVCRRLRSATSKQEILDCLASWDTVSANKVAGGH